MKPYIKAAAAFLIIWGTIYLVGAFIYWSFDAGDWQIGGRLVIAVMGTFASVAALAVAALAEDSA